MDLEPLNFQKVQNLISKSHHFLVGTNTILVKISDFENNQLQDVDEVKVKISNPQRNISPIEVPMIKISQEDDITAEFQGELTFGFSGTMANRN